MKTTTASWPQVLLGLGGPKLKQRHGVMACVTPKGSMWGHRGCHIKKCPSPGDLFGIRQRAVSSQLLEPHISAKS